MPLYSIETHGQLQPHLTREWLLTNGLGGFAASSVLGCNTRRYHGLLCAATLPPVGRMMMLARLGEIILVENSGERSGFGVQGFENAPPSPGTPGEGRGEGSDGRKTGTGADSLPDSLNPEPRTLNPSTNPSLEFSINQFGDTFHPRGDRYLRRFEINDIIRWEYDVEGVHVVKELQIPWLKNVVGVRYTVRDPRKRKLELGLVPFVNMRDFHGLRKTNSINFESTFGERHLIMTAGKHALHLGSDAGVFRREEGWWHDHTYAIEAERGLDDSEDLFAPGKFVLPVEAEAQITIWGNIDAPALHDWDAEIQRRRDAIGEACSLRDKARGLQSTGFPQRVPERASVSPTIRKLLRAANDFVVTRRAPDGRDGASIIAGYPWFADWGRDTFISLPGLLLTTRRFEQAKQVLTVFGEYVSEGMIPNRFDDYTNEPHYNTVDASLWYIHAAFEYLRLTHDAHTFETHLLPACRAIFDGYRRGTRFNIKMDEADGLITQGDATTQLTWMDAKYGNIAFTPRQGKAVEINALWYHALVLLNERELAEKVRQSFASAFWISPFRGLADVVDSKSPPIAMGGRYERDNSIRPNQIFAVSLPNSPLDEARQRAVVEVVRRELLTPVGLRSLAKGDPNYHGVYFGNPMQRDEAYHNGTVWAWLIGPFLDAYLRVNHRSAESIEQAKQWLQPLLHHMDTQACIGQISEIFEGDEPHRPAGCCAQAWSVAEVLRLAVQLKM